MAKITDGSHFIGTINNLSFYKMKGVEEIVVRGKGGPSAKKVKTSKVFVNTRRNNREFGGCSTAAKQVMQMLFPLKALADYNIAGSINRLLRPAKEMDTQHDWGQRSILLSAKPDLLAGFSLNMKNPFDAVVRNPIRYELDRSLLSAVIELPALIPGINFFVPWKYPLFSFQVTLGIVPDFYYDNIREKYAMTPGYENFYPQTKNTDWVPVSKGSEAETVELSLVDVPPDRSFTVMLSIGIRYGTIGAANTIEQVKYAGAAKVMATT